MVTNKDNVIEFCVIYKISAPDESVCYIGATNDFESRMKQHSIRKTGCKGVVEMVQKFGWENLTKEILFQGHVPKWRRKQIEAFEILLHDSFLNGANRSWGGDGICKEVRQKISKTKTGVPANMEAIMKTAEKNRGKKRTKEFKENHSRIFTGRIIKQESIDKGKETWKNKPLSEKKEISQRQSMSRILTNNRQKMEGTYRNTGGHAPFEGNWVRKMAKIIDEYRMKRVFAW